MYPLAGHGGLWQNWVGRCIVSLLWTRSSTPNHITSRRTPEGPAFFKTSKGLPRFTGMVLRPLVQRRGRSLPRFPAAHPSPALLSLLNASPSSISSCRCNVVHSRSARRTIVRLFCSAAPDSRSRANTHSSAANCFQFASLFHWVGMVQVSRYGWRRVVCRIGGSGGGRTTGGIRRRCRLTVYPFPRQQS